MVFCTDWLNILTWLCIPVTFIKKSPSSFNVHLEQKGQSFSKSFSKFICGCLLDFIVEMFYKHMNVLQINTAVICTWSCSKIRVDTFKMYDRPLLHYFSILMISGLPGSGQNWRGGPQAVPPEVWRSPERELDNQSQLDGPQCGQRQPVLGQLQRFKGEGRSAKRTQWGNMSVFQRQDVPRTQGDRYPNLKKGI